MLAGKDEPPQRRSMAGLVFNIDQAENNPRGSTGDEWDGSEEVWYVEH